MSDFVHTVEAEHSIDLGKVTGFHRHGHEVVFAMDGGTTTRWIFQTEQDAIKAIAGLFNSGSQRIWI